MHQSSWCVQLDSTLTAVLNGRTEERRCALCAAVLSRVSWLC